MANASSPSPNTSTSVSPNSNGGHGGNGDGNQVHNQRRTKFKPKTNSSRDGDVKCDSENDTNRIGPTKPEIEISSSVPFNETSDKRCDDKIIDENGDDTSSITMNTLLVPLNQIQNENISNSADNESDGM